MIFNPSQRNAVIASNLGIFAMIWAVTYASTIWGTGEVIKYYMFPWLLVSHWFIMITYVSDLVCAERALHIVADISLSLSLL